MGNWNISIRGVGAHHNKKSAQDANRMAAEFVRALEDAGHSVIDASFTHGGADDLCDADKYLADRNAIEKEEK